MVMCFRHIFILAAVLGVPEILTDDSFRDETVVSAANYRRKVASSNPSDSSSSSSSSGSSSGSSLSSGSCGMEHQGVVLNTKEGNSWLLHHPGPDSLTVVTDAKHMSNRWVKDHDIPVAKEKTVQEVYRAAEGRTTNPVINYVTGGTCVGVADRAERYLKEEPRRITDVFNDPFATKTLFIG